MKVFSPILNSFIGLWLFFLFLGAAAVLLGLIPSRALTMMGLVWFLGLSLFLSMKTRRNEALIASGIIFALLLTEAFLWTKEKISQSQNRRKYITQQNINLPDPILGSRFTPNIQSTSTLYRGSTLIHKATYSFDRAGRRSCSPIMPNAKRHAIFFGGSITFGEGVQDGDTLPSRTQQLLNGEYAAYNYGKGGWGTGQMLTLLGQKDFSDNIPYSKGFAVYVFIGDHIYRTTGKFRYVSYWPEYQIYGLDKNGVLKGPFRWDSDLRMSRWIKWMRFLDKTSVTMHYFAKRDWFHPIPSETAVEVTARVIHAAKAEYKSQFDGEFYVLIWPRLGLSDKLNNLFLNKLNEKNINIIQIPPYPDKEGTRIHPLDQHPSTGEYQWVAEHLVKTVKMADSKFRRSCPPAGLIPLSEHHPVER